MGWELISCHHWQYIVASCLTARVERETEHCGPTAYVSSERMVLSTAVNYCSSAIWQLQVVTDTDIVIAESPFPLGLITAFTNNITIDNTMFSSYNTSRGLGRGVGCMALDCYPVITVWCITFSYIHWQSNPTDSSWANYRYHTVAIKHWYYQTWLPEIDNTALCMMGRIFYWERFDCPSMSTVRAFKISNAHWNHCTNLCLLYMHVPNMLSQQTVDVTSAVDSNYVLYGVANRN